MEYGKVQYGLKWSRITGASADGYSEYPIAILGKSHSIWFKSPEARVAWQDEYDRANPSFTNFETKVVTSYMIRHDAGTIFDRIHVEWAD